MVATNGIIAALFSPCLLVKEVIPETMRDILSLRTPDRAAKAGRALSGSNTSDFTIAFQMYSETIRRITTHRWHQAAVFADSVPFGCTKKTKTAHALRLSSWE